MDAAAFANWFLVDRLRRCGDRGVFLALGWVLGSGFSWESACGIRVLTRDSEIRHPCVESC
jgi:enoyl-CoA hydratase/carnithine racemase